MNLLLLLVRIKTDRKAKRDVCFNDWKMWCIITHRNPIDDYAANLNVLGTNALSGRK